VIDKPAERKIPDVVYPLNRRFGVGDDVLPLIVVKKSILHENLQLVSSVNLVYPQNLLFAIVIGKDIVSNMVQRKQVQAISLLGLLALMVMLMGKLMLPYMSVILWSAVAYILISPLHSAILRRMNPKKKGYEALRHLLAGVFSLGTVLLLAGMLFFIGFQLLGQGKLFLEEVHKWLTANPEFFRTNILGTRITEIVAELSLGTIDISRIDLKAELLSFIGSYSASIMTLTTGILKNLGNFVLSLVFICFALYFFYLDAKYLADVFINAIPIDKKSSRRLLSKFRDVTKNLFKGFFLVAFYQAIAAFLLFTIFNIRGALLFSVLILFSSFVPMVGCALIWFPLGLSVLASKGVVAGVVFMVLCAFFISFLDNFLRPLFLKDRIKIHPLLIFFSILGGLQVFGMNGILLGPIVIILFFTIVDIALEVEAPQDTADDTGLPEEPASIDPED